MIIETKYNIGDKVQFETSNGEEFGVIVMISTLYDGNDDEYAISYLVKASDYSINDDMEYAKVYEREIIKKIEDK
ncbi:MAG: hypothetical protein ACI4N3_04845 [Alphaproteobacteria bacterium]